MRFNNLILLFVAYLSSFSPSVFSAESLTVYSVDEGIGRFHREDNRIHRYPNNSAFKNFILPNNARFTNTLTINNRDGSVTIFYDNMVDFLKELKKVSAEKSKLIGILTFEMHGAPGVSGSPRDEIERDSEACANWRKSSLNDRAAYDEYYSPISKQEIDEFNDLAKGPFQERPCALSGDGWENLADRIGGLKEILTNDVQITFASCEVGNGDVGDQFVKKLARTFLSAPEGRVVTQIDFGVGDWSTPLGVGFWNYVDDTQLADFNLKYPVERKDANFAMQGSIRIGLLDEQLQPGSFIRSNIDYFNINKKTDLAFRPTSF